MLEGSYVRQNRPKKPNKESFADKIRKAAQEMGYRDKELDKKAQEKLGKR